MAREPSPEIDDELFNEVYGKAYSGPVAPAANSVIPKVNDEKRPLTTEKSDDEDEPRDPNAVPTDFTSREARVWEAKAKATERNWKKRKEEEMICKICGESGHFTQVILSLCSACGFVTMLFTGHSEPKQQEPFMI
jgi:ribosomal protein L37E